MKQNYITPTVEIVKIDDNQLLAASTPEYDGPFNAPDLDDWEEFE